VVVVVGEDTKEGTEIVFLQMWNFSQSLKAIKIRSHVCV
jgi:hypothetical protein